MKLEVNVEKRYAVGIIVLLALAIGIYSVHAFGGNQPNVMGHTWGEIANIPAGFADGVDNEGSVPDNLKDGVSWNEVSGIPAGFADGVDNGVPAGFIEMHTSDGDGVFFLSNNVPSTMAESGSSRCYFKVVNGQPQMRFELYSVADEGWKNIDPLSPGHIHQRSGQHVGNACAVGYNEIIIYGGSTSGDHYEVPTGVSTIVARASIASGRNEQSYRQ